MSHFESVCLAYLVETTLVKFFYKQWWGVTWGKCGWKSLWRTVRPWCCDQFDRMTALDLSSPLLLPLKTTTKNRWTVQLPKVTMDVTPEEKAFPRVNRTLLTVNGHGFHAFPSDRGFAVWPWKSQVFKKLLWSWKESGRVSACVQCGYLSFSKQIFVKHIRMNV